MDKIKSNQKQEKTTKTQTKKTQQKKIKTPNQKAYEKEIKNLQRRLKRYENQGYTHNITIVPNKKRITKKAIQEITKLKGKELKNKLITVDTQTGKILKGTQATKYIQNNTKPKKQTILTNFDEHVIEMFRQEIKMFPKMAEPFLSTWLSNVISRYGKEQTVDVLIAAKERGVILTYEISYSEDLLRQYASDMLDLFDDIGELTKDDILENLDYQMGWYEPT